MASPPTPTNRPNASIPTLPLDNRAFAHGLRISHHARYDLVQTLLLLVASLSPHPLAEYAIAGPRSSFDVHASDRPRLAFSPAAMVRNSIPTPTYEIIHGRTPANLNRHSQDDSRVHEPIDDAPDPELPLVPLRLTTDRKY